MTPTELMIHDLSEIMADMTMPAGPQKRAIFKRTLESLVNFAISQREVEQLNGIRSDLLKVEQIRRAAKNP